MRDWIVVKVGGGITEEFDALKILLDDIVALRETGAHVVLMHGGGPQATALSQALGYETRMVGGRRVTDAKTLEVMKMVLGGKVATDLLSACRAAGIRAVHVSGVADGVIQATKRPPRCVSGGGDGPVDFGYVGDITAVDTRSIRVLAEAGVLPILNSLGADEDGQVLNINADIAATRLAVALNASALFLSTGAPGVLLDPRDWSTRIPTLSAAEADELIEKGVIDGGMIPKLQESFRALAAGLRRIHIVHGKEPDAMRREWARPGSVGTALLSSKEEIPDSDES